MTQNPKPQTELFFDAEMTMAKPDNAIDIETYKELADYVRAFSEGHFNLLIIIGQPGLQKTRLVRDALGQRSVCWLEGNATPFAFFCELWWYRDEPIVIDDLDAIYRDRAAVRLLKCLCQTELSKTVSWNSAANLLKSEAIPRRFRTRSPVAIIVNEWKTLNRNVQAIEDRGHVIFFQPTSLEVHERVAEWFWDQEIFDFIGLHLHLMVRPSMRYYVLAYEKKQAGLDWRSALLQRFVSGTARVVANLLADPSYDSEEDRARAFTAVSGYARSTYFRVKAELYAQVPPPNITLRRKSPPAVDTAIPEDIVAILRQRFGKLGRG